MEQLREEVRQLRLELVEHSAAAAVSSKQLEHIEEHASKVEHLIWGTNGHKGLLVRIDRMENMFSQIRWILGILTSLVASLVGRLLWTLLQS